MTMIRYEDRVCGLFTRTFLRRRRGVRVAVLVHARGAIAENFCEMASEVEIEERIDSCQRWGERARYRDSETILSRCLDGDQFLEFWTRLQESIHGVRPWYESSQDSPGRLLLTALGR